jgi:cytochrome c peroxidase
MRRTNPTDPGLTLFRGKAKCTACHLGPTFSDERFHNTGAAVRNGRLADQGRFNLTGREQDRGAFKTPTLREVARSAPYMHDGEMATLEEVIDFYDAGGRPNPTLDAEINPLKLSDQEKLRPVGVPPRAHRNGYGRQVIDTTSRFVTVR